VTIYFMGVDLMTTWPHESWPHGNWPGGNGPQETKSLLTTLIKSWRAGVYLNPSCWWGLHIGLNTLANHITQNQLPGVLDILDKEQYQR